MLERLGSVLYWLGCGFGAVIVIVGMFAGSGAATLGIQVSAVIGAIILGAIAWLIGRACRYVLAGR